jgi:hypothetical protein
VYINEEIELLRSLLVIEPELRKPLVNMNYNNDKHILQVVENLVDSCGMIKVEADINDQQQPNILKDLDMLINSRTSNRSSSSNNYKKKFVFTPEER